MNRIILLVLAASAAGAVLNFLLSMRHARKQTPAKRTTASILPDHGFEATLDPVSRVRTELLKATKSEEVKVLSDKPGRIVYRLDLRDSSTAIAKVALEATSRASSGIFVEAQILNYLAAWNVDVVPRLRHVTVLREHSICLIRDDARGQDLHRHMANIADSGRWPRIIDALEVLSSAARATAKLHECDVVHGDLKPANLVFQFDSEYSLRFTSNPCIIDFDSAQIARNVTVSASAGTLGFCAPERYFASYPLKQSDVYALGSIAVFLFTGRPGLSTNNPRIPDFLRPIVEKATHSLPFDRYDDAEQFADKIDQLSTSVSRRVKRQVLDWPKDWKSQIQPIMTQSIYFDKPLPSRKTRVPAERVSVLSVVIDDLVKRVLNGSDRKFVEDFLNESESLSEFAKGQNMSADQAFNKLNRSLVAVQKAVQKELADRAASVAIGSSAAK